ncbi:MAG TPA: hypothetical protein VNC21_07140, partial [Vicinamibacterales bacterium]|nr:hypothetical protein [Vicinamibacterales bacterium]
MNFVIVLEGTELHPSNDADPEALARFSRSRDPADRVVVSERERLEAALCGSFDYLPRRKGAIGRGRVSVKVYKRRRT